MTSPGERWKDPKFLAELILSFVAMVISLNIFSHFLDWVELRGGAPLDDPILAALSPQDVTWYTFVFIYGAIITAFVACLFRPKHMAIAFQTYTIMVFIRMIAMYLTPLEAPRAIIILADPFVEFFGTGKPLTRDLFFSGHTATMFILFLTAAQKKVRIALFVGTIVVGSLVILQHVHYSIDVFAALFFSYGAYRIVINARKYLAPEDRTNHIYRTVVGSGRKAEKVSH
ncbi:sphingomyelin synthase family protein [bacterium]|nr:sphingomyelin synthase family protein [bacterium]